MKFKQLKIGDFGCAREDRLGRCGSPVDTPFRFLSKFNNLANSGRPTLCEDVRILVETATLAGAVIGSGKRFSLRRVAIEENIPD